MINKFHKKENRREQRRKLNELVHSKNKQDRIKSNQTLSSPYRFNQKIYWGEVESNNDDGTFTGTFYDANGDKVTSSSTYYYQQEIIGSGAVGSVFGAVKYSNDWYSVVGSGGAGTIHNAYVNGTVSSGTTQSCFLDADDPSTAEEITVYCSICGGLSLNSAIPRLEDGKLIPVYYDGTNWRSCTVFQASEVCDGDIS